MISHAHRYIFVHIPKCGGTSIEFALLKNEGVNPRDSGKISKDLKEKFRIWYKYEGEYTQHRKIDKFKNDSEKKYFTFTFIRNPYERFLSSYFYLQKSYKKRGLQERLVNFKKKFPTFNDFVKGEHSTYFYPGHEDLQIDYVLNASKYKMINFIGRCEDMQTDFDYICKKLKFKNLKLPHRNPTKHKHYTEYYDNETREIVAEKYAKDIEYFGYEFGK